MPEGDQGIDSHGLAGQQALAAAAIPSTKQINKPRNVAGSYNGTP